MEIEKPTRGETHQVILERIQHRLPEWSEYVTLDKLSVERLNGLSNACYKVSVANCVDLPSDTPRVLLYRKFECQIVDRRIETAIFKCMSESGLGPKLIY